MLDDPGRGLRSDRRRWSQNLVGARVAVRERWANRRLGSVVSPRRPNQSRRQPLAARTDATFLERFVPSADGARLDYTMTIADPKYLTDVVTLEKSWINVPGTQVLPFNCTP